MKEYTLKTGRRRFSAGEAFLLKETDLNKERNAADPGEEAKAFHLAVKTLVSELKTTAMGAAGDSAAIFDTELLFLEDESFTGKILEAIGRDHMSASLAVQRAGEELSREIESAESDYLRGRGEDVRGMVKRLISILEGREERMPDKPAILIAYELSPAQFSAIPDDKILGIITAKGSATSHLSILADNLGVPCLYGFDDATMSVKDGARLIISGDKLITEPSDEDYAAAVEKTKEELERRKSLKAQGAGIETRTKIYANVSGPGDREALIDSGADGVGLFRSEFIFLGDKAPDEEEQFAAYRAIVEAMGEKETVIRTMDLGSDKTPAWLDLPREKNPALGLRGIRVSLQNTDLFKTQLRALLRAAVFGNLKIMLPMIASPREVEESRKIMELCANELKNEGVDYKIPPLGIMIETPAAVMIADELGKIAAFFSIGTNDLTQYALALDREGEGLDDYYKACHKGVLQLIKMTAEAAHRNDIPVAVCGELAGNPEAIGALIEAGVDELSVAITKIGDARALAARVEKELAEKAAASGSVAAVADGYIIPMEEIPDEAFSSGTMGACFGIMPDNGRVYAPCDGVVSAIAQTKHALTIERNGASDILIHVGIDTVKLSGEGFTMHVNEGDFVNKNDLLMEADVDMIKARGYSPMIITVF